MKKNLKWIAIILLLIFLSFNMNKYFKNYNIEIKSSDEKFNFNLCLKGLKGARDFVVLDNGDYYIAYRDRVQIIKNDGKSYELFKDKGLDISSIQVCNDEVYYSSKGRVFAYNIESKKNKCLIDNMPNFGDYSSSKIEKFKNYLFISIGAATNSGVVGEDNLWIKENPYNCDISPKTLTIKGTNFGKEKTGAFVPFGTSNIKGQMLPGHFPGNASIIIYNLDTGAAENFAWGIRNVRDMKINSEGRLIAIVGGMEDRGLRPVKGDVDYIYGVQKGMWYGWPDYSGGDPINSPRFKGKNGERMDFLLDKHPSTNPPAPLYQHKTLSSLGALAIDKAGILGDKDSMYFYDEKERKLCSLSKKGILRERASIESSEKVSLKFSNDKLNILDRKKGLLFTVDISPGESKNRNTYVYIYLMILFMGIIGVIIYTKVKKIIIKGK